MNKKAMFSIIDLIAGAIIIAGGVLVLINYVNVGLLLAGLGTVFEAVKIVLQQGAR